MYSIDYRFIANTIDRIGHKLSSVCRQKCCNLVLSISQYNSLLWVGRGEGGGGGGGGFSVIAMALSVISKYHLFQRAKSYPIIVAT